MKTSRSDSQLIRLKRSHSPDPVHSERVSKKAKYSLDHPTRDLKIIVWADGRARFWTVSSWATSQASRVWEAYILEAYETMAPISCVEDDVNALEILLNAVHHNFSAIPEFVPFGELLQLAKLREKYETARLFKDRAGSWIGQAWTCPEWANHEGWLQIAWVFKDLIIFQYAVDNILMNMCKSRSSLVQEDYWVIGDKTLNEKCIPSNIFGESGNQLPAVQSLTFTILATIIVIHVNTMVTPPNTDRSIILCANTGEGNATLLATVAWFRD